ncbi:hypothetical protein AAL_05678 [Moelleriella libera RCEF 2490]|uniref:Uncharacterized protein n=1 Tax=Moelleriella libera RCEF 2490 TaxID=1081109 RepID=A0A162IGZ4_9HYPO|nr:hypothetical protein AAL_05678 [Moelleriella libera RCEF 2490]
MENLSLSNRFPPNTLTSTVPPVGSSKQPTYTTAGTIYKPSSSQPLQAPTRRGRSIKWSSHGLNADLALLPKSVLAGLPLKIPSTATIPALPQYTPLQQNYDRAISPFNDPDHILAKFPLIPSRVPLSFTPRVLPMTLPEVNHQGFVPVQDEEPRLNNGCNTTDDREGANGANENDEDVGNHDLNNSALQNMTVKSLQNLASYSNPHQKTAQRILQRGIRTRPSALSTSMSSMPPGNSPPLSPFAVTPASVDAASLSSTPKYCAQTDQFPSHKAQTDAISKLDGAWSTRHNTPAPIPVHPPRARSTNSEPRRSNKHLNGNGTPMPLTAGPPGQRQYRPSTFESTFKALKVQSPQASANKEDDQGLLTATQALVQSGIEDFSTPSVTLEAVSNVRSQSPTITANEEEQSTRTSGLPAGREHHLGSFASQGIAEHAERPGYQLLVQSVNWRDPSPRVRALFSPGTDRLTNEALAARHSDLEGWWQGRVDKKRRVENHPIEKKQAKPDQPRSFGVIGDRRKGAVHARLENSEAGEGIAIPLWEHSRPLIRAVAKAVDRGRR